jgi:archaellum component FlaC
MKKVNKKIKKETTIDDLAIMVQNGFMEVKSEIGGMKSGIGGMKSDIKNIKADVEDIKTDLSRRVHIFDHKDLEFRVEKLEEKVGITRKK